MVRLYYYFRNSACYERFLFTIRHILHINRRRNSLYRSGSEKLRRNLPLLRRFTAYLITRHHIACFYLGFAPGGIFRQYWSQLGKPSAFPQNPKTSCGLKAQGITMPPRSFKFCFRSSGLQTVWYFLPMATTSAPHNRSRVQRVASGA